MHLMYPKKFAIVNDAFLMNFKFQILNLCIHNLNVQSLYQQQGKNRIIATKHLTNKFYISKLYQIYDLKTERFQIFIKILNILKFFKQI